MGDDGSFVVGACFKYIVQIDWILPVFHINARLHQGPVQVIVNGDVIAIGNWRCR